MVKKLIEIPTNSDKIYLQILAIMNFLIGATPQERQVISELIRLNNDYEALDDPEKRAKFILSTEMRREMRNRLNMKEKQFNTIIARLKKIKTFNGKTVLDKNGVLNSALIYKPSKDGYEIILRIKNTEKPKPSSTEKIESDNEEVEQETKEEATEDSERKLAKPSNGPEGIVQSNVSNDDIEIF